jgi:hypothetical protein
VAENQELAVVLRLVATQFQSELTKSKGLLGDFTKVLTDWKTQALAVAGALFAITKPTASYADEALKGAQKTQTTVESFQKLAYAAKIADVEQGQLIIGMKGLSQFMVQTGQEGRSLQDMLLQTADKFSKMADGAVKNTLAVKMFGKAGLDLIPFLNMGRAGIVDLMHEAERLGIVMSEKDARAAAQFEDEFKKLTSATIGLRNALGVQLIPIMTDVIKLIREGVVLINTPAGQAFLRLLTGQSGLGGIAARSLAAMVGGKGGESGTGAGGGGAVDEDNARKVREAAMKGQLEVIEAMLTAEVNKYKTAADTKIAQAELEGSRRIKTEQDVQTEIGSIRSGVFNAELTILDQLRALYAAYYAQRKALGFKDREDEEKFQQDHAKKVVEINGKIATKMEEWDAAGIRSAIEREEKRRQILLLSQATLQQMDTEERARRRQGMIENANFVQLYQLGLREYITNLSSTFNVAVDAARQTADAMRQGFKTFFFDAMNLEFKSFQDVVNGVMNSVKNIIAEVLAQLITLYLLKKALAVGILGGADVDAGSINQGGGIQRRFALGGPVLFSNGDRVPALLTPGEYVINRNGVNLLDRINQGILPQAAGGGAPTVNIYNAPAGTGADVDFRRVGENWVVDVILRNMRRNGVLRQAFGGT